jgi:phage tail tape-measure protein
MEEWSMPRVLVCAFALMIGLGPSTSMANEQGAAAGAVTGAVAGAVVGGPIGAVIGAVVGGVAGNAAIGPADAQAEVAQVPGLGPAQPRVAVPVAPSGPVLLQEPEATGTIVEQRTCVREADGKATCRVIR